MTPTPLQRKIERLRDKLLQSIKSQITSSPAPGLRLTELQKLSWSAGRNESAVELMDGKLVVVLNDTEGEVEPIILHVTVTCINEELKNQNDQ